MPEPLPDAYVKKTERLITEVPAGPWAVEANEHGLPDQVGPVAFLQTWADSNQVPVLEFISHAREALPRYIGEIARLKAQIRELERAKGGVSHGR